MNGNFDRQRHAMIVEQLYQPASVSHCLIYEQMLDVTPEFDEFARRHFASIRGIAWRDLCPAYAMGLMTHDTYHLPGDSEELETLWEELAKSDLSWAQASQVVTDVWKWLDEKSGAAAPSQIHSSSDPEEFPEST